MTATKKAALPPPPPPRAREQLHRPRAEQNEPAGPEGTTSKQVEDTEGHEQDISGKSPGFDADPAGVRVGVDPRDQNAAPGPQDHEDNVQVPGGGYVDTGGALHAAPPTPTREHALTANDEPGAGTSGGPSRRPRADLAPEADLVDVEPIRQPFRLTDDRGAEHEYGPATRQMPRAHATHWYAKNHGVRLKE